MKIFNAYIDFKTFGGAELVAINLTKGLIKKNIDTYLLSNTSKKRYNEKYEVKDLNTSIFTFKLLISLNKEDVIISHHRKITTKLILLKKVFSLKFRLIHVAHNEFYNLKLLTLFPEEIVAVSEKVKQNLNTYFGISNERIKVIYNGICDSKLTYFEKNDSAKTRILLPARVNKVKQQVEIVKNLRNQLNSNIEIHFAGIGDDLNKLMNITKDNDQFKVLGFVSVADIIHNYDYVMLYSKVEGLPTVLIEACMNAKPLICNNVGGNFEILEINKNGFFANNYEDLKQNLNSLPSRNSNEYKMLCLNSRQKYLDCFTFKKMVDSYFKIINS